MLGGGDKLARGNVSAQFNPASTSDEKFKEMFGEEALRKLNLMSESDRKRIEQEAEQRVQEAVETSKVIFHPVQDRILVTRFEEEEKRNGLFVPDEAKEKPAKGVVVAVGPGRWVDGSLQSVGVKVGDKVAFGKYSGAEIQLGFDHYLILREDDIFGWEEQ